jgi:hypothetical protein
MGLFRRRQKAPRVILTFKGADGRMSRRVIDPNVPPTREEIRLVREAEEGIARGREADRLEVVRGRHYSEWTDTVRQLKREGRYEEALDLLGDCMDAAERSAAVRGTAPAPWYTEQAAIIHRKLKDYDGEVAVLKRYLEMAPGLPDDDSFVVRLAKARALQRKVAEAGVDASEES